MIDSTELQLSIQKLASDPIIDRSDIVKAQELASQAIGMLLAEEQELSNNEMFLHFKEEGLQYVAYMIYKSLLAEAESSQSINDAAVFLNTCADHSKILLGQSKQQEMEPQLNYYVTTLFGLFQKKIVKLAYKPDLN